MEAELEDRPVREGRPEDTSASGMRWPYAVLAYLALALAIVGVVLPGLPFTPFLLVSAWAANRGSRKLHDWLHRHPHFGPVLADWNAGRAIATSTKLIAVAFLATSWVLMLWRGIPAWLLAFLGAVFVAVATYILTRPRPRH